jgi:hypothetical protein
MMKATLGNNSYGKTNVRNVTEETSDENRMFQSTNLCKLRMPKMQRQQT